MTILSRAQVSQYAAQAGFKDQALVIALAIAQAESGFNTEAIDHDSNGSTDYGLWQINSIHGFNSSSLLNSPLYNAQAAYKVSGGGSNWKPWTTYTSGAYLKFMPNGTGPSSSPSPAVQSAQSNTYPKGQCTWWANERYHQLTGYYVPWSGNAKDWAALASKHLWKVSSTPVYPSIVCLQAGVQGADPAYGHVAVAESANKDGTIHTSDLNWGLSAAARAKVSYVNFKPGAGVSFITAAAPGSQLVDVGDQGPGGSGLAGLGGDLQNIFAAWGSLFGAVYVQPGESVLNQVHDTLINNPGFYGIALAVDEAEQFPGYQNLASGPFDVIGIVRSVGASIADNYLPAAIRGSLISLGAFIVLLLVLKAVLGVTETVGGDLLPLLGAM